MLYYLYVKNISSILETTIYFSAGMNAITGPTGSGKSTVFDIIRFVFGMKNKAYITNPDNNGQAKIEIEIGNEIKEKMKECGLNIPNKFIITRILYTNGKTKSFLNDSQIKTQHVKYLGFCIFGVSPGDGGQQFNSSYYCMLLDRFSGIKTNTISELYYKIKRIDERILTLKSQYNFSKEEYLYAQESVKEIEDLQIEDGEEEVLLKKIGIYRHYNHNLSFLQEAKNMLENTNLFRCTSVLNKIKELDVSHIIDSIDSIDIELKNIGKNIDCLLYSKSDTFNIEEIEERISVLRKASRKYRCNIADLKSVVNNFRSYLASIDTAEQEIDKLKKEKEYLLKQYMNASHSVSRERKLACESFIAEITQDLSLLGMNGVKLYIDINTNENNTSFYGIDTVCFYVSTMRHMKPTELYCTFSRGELSRFILVMHKLLNTSTEVLLLDEIDIGTSGDVVSQIGRYVYIISNTLQILIITHQQHIADMAINNISVQKIHKNNTSHIIVTKHPKEENTN